MFKKYFDELEKLIDPKIEDDLYTEWVEFHEGKFKGNVFNPSRKIQQLSELKLPFISRNSIVENMQMMVIFEISNCINHLQKGDGFLLGVECRYGTGILPTVFGAEIFLMDDAINTMQMALPFKNPIETAMRLLDKGVPDIRTGLGAKVFDTAEYFLTLMKDYPKISKYVYLIHPDLQGPIDVCEILWGSSLFIDLYDHSELIKDFLSLITETYKAFMTKWYELYPASDNGYSVNWDMLHKGNLAIRLDSATNISPEMYAEFSEPYDSMLMEYFGGGVLHFCGRGDHYIDRATAIAGVGTVDMSQPRCNNMEKIYNCTIDRGINLIGMPEHWVNEQLAKGFDFKGRVHCKWRPGTDNVNE